MFAHFQIHLYMLKVAAGKVADLVYRTQCLKIDDAPVLVQSCTLTGCPEIKEN